MCGIAGWVRPGGAPIDRAQLEGMTATLVHRGPDGGAIHVEPGCGLGHRRLSLLDAAGGTQPMSNEDGSVWVTANNEIYNYRELRARLTQRGHRFQSHSDTEVLVHLFEDRGPALLDALIGMYAFALWDRATRTLVLARDRFGIKPLYYAIDADGGLRFASELRALLATPGIDRTVDFPAVREYLRHLAIPEPHTILRAVRKLPAAHCLVWQDGRTALHRYWRLPDRDGAASHDAGALDALEEALLASVALTLRSDEPLGLFLSGGIDSSVLAWAMQRTTGTLRTFSVAFAEPQFDESEHSRCVAAALASEHRQIRVTADRRRRGGGRPARPRRRALRRFLGAADGPDRASRARIGQGRAGRRGRRRAVRRQPVAYPRGRRQRRRAARAGGEGGVLDGAARRPAERRNTRTDVLRPARGGRHRGGRHARRARSLPSATGGRPADVSAVGPLTKMDRMAMRHSLESRVPYLDHPLAELVWRLPTSAKYRDGVRKHLLRRIAARRLPAAIAARGKQGFAIPIDVWTWQPGRFRDLVYDTLRAPPVRQCGWFDAARVEAMLAEHDRAQTLHGHRLWTLVGLASSLAQAW